jgi:hypothetical protein
MKEGWSVFIMHWATITPSPLKPGESSAASSSQERNPNERCSARLRDGCWFDKRAKRRIAQENTQGADGVSGGCDPMSARILIDRRTYPPDRAVGERVLRNDKRPLHDRKLLTGAHRNPGGQTD